MTLNVRNAGCAAFRDPETELTYRVQVNGEKGQPELSVGVPNLPMCPNPVPCCSPMTRPKVLDIRVYEVYRRDRSLKPIHWPRLDPMLFADDAGAKSWVLAQTNLVPQDRKSGRTTGCAT